MQQRGAVLRSCGRKLSDHGLSVVCSLCQSLIDNANKGPTLRCRMTRKGQYLVILGETRISWFI